MVVITHIDIYLCLDTSIRMDPKLKAESQYVVKNVSSGDIIPCLLDTGSRLSIIAEHFAQQYNFQAKFLKQELLTKQLQEALDLQKMCRVDLKLV